MRSPRHARRWSPRHRWPRRRRLAGFWVLLVAMGGAIAFLVPSTGPAFAAADQPTINFLGGGPAPLACTSKPDLTNITVKRNTRIVLANFTGADATVDLGGKPTRVADGEAISVKFKEGTYDVAMVADCLQVYGVVAVRIVVVRSEVPPASPTPGPSPGGPPSTSAGFVAPFVAPAPDTPGESSSSPSSSSESPSADPSLAGEPELAGGPDIEATKVLPPPSPPDNRGRRLLALIAAICVFGVASAIIRAIVAQRATGALGT